MPSDDRELNFEKALASHVRAGDSAGELHGACSDAETLAAFHEGSLDPLQMAFLKTHVSECARCQEILANLQATDGITVAETHIAPQEGSAAQSGILALPVRKPTLWRWVAPVGALAAALLVWVAVQDTISVQHTSPSAKISTRQDQTAKNVQPSTSASPPAPALDSTPRSEARESEPLEALNASPESRIPGVPKPSTKPPSGSPLKQKDSASATKKSPAVAEFGQLAKDSPGRLAPAVPGDSKSLDPGAMSQVVEVAPKTEETRNEMARSEAAKIDAEIKVANDKRDATASRSLQPAPAPVPPPSSGMAGAAPVATPRQTETVQVDTGAAAVSGGVTQRQEMEGMSRFDQKAQMRLASGLGEVTVSAPDGRTSWRIGPAGVIEFSSDAGKTWIVQPSGIIADLLAGSAPSAKVCWIVGRNGTILRTSDGGKHWRKINPPVPVDLRSVFAVDAQQATVSPANGSYQTTDGGATWNKLPPE
jgi:hypothetical protein